MLGHASMGVVGHPVAACLAKKPLEEVEDPLVEEEVHLLLQQTCLAMVGA